MAHKGSSYWKILSRPISMRGNGPLLYRSIYYIALFICLITPSLLACKQADAQHALQKARVIRVNDGDTITLRMDGRIYKARLIGFDAPEMGQEPWGKKAREHLRTLLKNSDWNVSVETDIEKYDKYNRLLIYVWTRDKTFVNERMLADGYAVLFTFPPNTKYVDLFKKAQRLARENKNGIWGPDGLKERPVEYKKKHPRE
jgi:micrococcal nuclease